MNERVLIPLFLAPFLAVANAEEVEPFPNGLNPNTLLLLKKEWRPGYSQPKKQEPAGLRLVFEATSWNPCTEHTVYANIWLVSDHGDGGRKKNEKNYGGGLVYGCNGFLHIQRDRIKNSNWGWADLTAFTIEREWISWNGFSAKTRLGRGYLRYEVPWAGVTLSGNVKVGYVILGYKDLAINLAPVPKQKDTYIVFASYKLAEF